MGKALGKEPTTAQAAAVLYRAADTDYRAIFRAFTAPVALLELSDETRIVDVSAAFLALLGHRRDRIVGRDIRNVFMPAAAASIGARASRARASAIASEFEIPVRGDEPALSCTVKPLGGDDALVLLSLAQMPKRLSVGERRHALMFDRLSTLNNGLTYIYDFSTERTRYINAHLATFFGLTPNGGVDLQSVIELVHPDDIDPFNDHMAALRILRDEAVAHGAFRIKRADGAWRLIDNRARIFARARNGKARCVIGCAFDVTETRQVSDELAVAHSALLQAQENERRRIARELHDSTAQYLVAIDLGLSAFERNLQDSPHFADLEDERTAIAESRRLLSLALREVRTFSFLLHPPRLEEHGLEATLRAFVQGFARRTGLDVNLQIVGARAKLDPTAELNFFRVAQEALMNVHRHARASAVTIRLERTKRDVVLEIADNGIGGAFGEKHWQDGERAGVGISGMRARMAQHGGSLSVQFGHHGATVSASAPLIESVANVVG
ncbi:MAG: histidine kinase [Pseudomonadota bacterium]